LEINNAIPEKLTVTGKLVPSPMHLRVEGEGNSFVKQAGFQIKASTIFEG
jgi:hypothetical protein